MTERMFPVRCQGSRRAIPWAMAEEAYAVYAARYRTNTTLERFAERGGFSEVEMDLLLPDWRARLGPSVTLREWATDPARGEDYQANYRCADCGEHHYLDCSLPSDIWNQIATPDTALCAKCIDRRLVAKGLKATCRFYFVGEALMGDTYADPAGAAHEPGEG